MKARGFTLIELLVTVTIIGILAAVAVPFGELAVRRNKEQQLRVALRDIRIAIDAYKKAVDEGRIQKAGDGSGYPPTLEILVEGVQDAKQPDDRAKIYFLRRMPRDPFSDTPELKAEATWGKRSYESPPSDPAPGKDVFDVYSLAPGVGINGIAYREW